MILHPEYIDNLAVVGVEAADHEDLAKEVYEGGAKQLKVAGLDLHTEIFGICSLWACSDSRSYGSDVVNQGRMRAFAPMARS